MGVGAFTAIELKGGGLKNLLKQSKTLRICGTYSRQYGVLKSLTELTALSTKWVNA